MFFNTHQSFFSARNFWRETIAFGQPVGLAFELYEVTSLPSGTNKRGSTEQKK